MFSYLGWHRCSGTTIPRCCETLPLENMLDKHLLGQSCKGRCLQLLFSPALCFYRELKTETKPQTSQTPKLQPAPTSSPQCTHTPKSAVLPCWAAAPCHEAAIGSAATSPAQRCSPQCDVSRRSSGLKRFSTRGRVLTAASRQAVTWVIVPCRPGFLLLPQPVPFKQAGCQGAACTCGSKSQNLLESKSCTSQAPVCTATAG